MKIKDHFNAMMAGASIVSLDRIFGEDPILGYITKAIFLFLFITFIYVNLRDQ